MEELAVASGRDILRLFDAAVGWLESRAGMLDSINVFPVPDGDTGANMLRTMKAALAAAGWPHGSAPGSGSDSPHASTVVAALARGAFEGARGNSGVILSQLFRGLASALAGKTRCTADDLRDGFRKAHEFARAGLAQPVEGTILTVLGDVARALETRQMRGSIPFSVALETAVDAAKESVMRSPFLLAVLRESGVVDAGAKGLFFILEGALRAVKADAALPDIREWSPLPAPEDSFADRPTAGWLSGGYCTGLIIEGTNLSADEIRGVLTEKGSSLIVAGTGDAVRIHIHTMEPDSVLAYARSRGTVSRIEVEALPETGARDVPVAVVAVVPGEGFIDVFRGLGAHAIVTHAGGQQAKTEEILAGARTIAAARLIILPNGQEGIAPAEEAARICGRDAMVVPTRTIPQGIAAAVAFRHEEGLAENVSLMRAAAGAVRTLEISWDPAGGDGSPDPVSAFLDGQDTGTFDSPTRALEALVSRIDLAAAGIVTLYIGAGVEEHVVQRIHEWLIARQSLLSIEGIESRQRRPQLIIGVE
jgi:hypothetical protein